MGLLIGGIAMDRFVFFVLSEDEVRQGVEKMTTGEHAFDKKTAVRILHIFDNILSSVREKEKADRMLNELKASLGF